jgi:hypothetical protein
MKAEQLLQRAKEILDGSSTPAQPRRMRIAAFLIRQVLEEEVSVACERLVARMDHPVRMRSRLLVLHVLDQTGVAGKIEYAWNALSRACHHHAYELAPTTSELQHLLTVVTHLVDSRANLAAGAPK